MSGGPQIELRPAADLVPYARNSRTHSPEQLAQIQESYRRFGMNTPIGVDADGILVGHGRVLAAVAMWENGEDVPGPGKRQPLPPGPSSSPTTSWRLMRAGICRSSSRR
jgi:hypothetical protein